MPYEELLVYLASLGDEVVRDVTDQFQHGEVIEVYTRNGLRYVRSRNGTRFDGWAWWPKYLWTRAPV